MLTSGENVEPQPVEDVLCCSPYIKFAGAAINCLPACILPACILPACLGGTGSWVLFRLQGCALPSPELRLPPPSS